MHPCPLCARSRSQSLSHSVTLSADEETRHQMLAAARCRFGEKEGQINAPNYKNVASDPLWCQLADLCRFKLATTTPLPLILPYLFTVPFSSDSSIADSSQSVVFADLERVGGSAHVFIYVCARAHVNACVWALHCLPAVRISRWGAGGGTGEAWQANIDSASDADIYLLKGRVLWLMTGLFLIF